MSRPTAEGAATAPTAWQAIDVHRRLHALRLRRGRMRFVALLLLALPAVGTAALALAGGWGRDLFDNVLEVHFRLLVLLVPSLATASAVSEEIESRTFTFVFARPAPRWAMPIGKYLAAVPALAALFVASVTLSYLVAMVAPPATGRDFVEGLGHLARALVAVALGAAVFGAIAEVLGAWFTRAPLVAVLGYLLLVEGLLASLGMVVSVAGMSWHLRNLAQLPVGLAAGPLSVFAAPHLDAWISVVVLVVVGAAALAGAAASVAGAEYSTDR